MSMLNTAMSYVANVSLQLESTLNLLLSCLLVFTLF
jgi:hypothetical protein